MHIKNTFRSQSDHCKSVPNLEDLNMVAIWLLLNMTSEYHELINREHRHITCLKNDCPMVLAR